MSLRTSPWLALICAVAMAIVQPGCKSQPTQSRAQAAPEAQAESVTTDTQAQAQRLAEAMALSAQDPPKPVGPQVEWLDSPQTATPSPAPQPEPTPQANTAIASVDDADQPDPKAAEDEPADEPAADAGTLTRQQLLDALFDDILASDEPDLERAINAALLTLGQPGRDIDPQLMTQLDSAQREQVARFQSMIQLFRHQLTTGDGEVNRRDAEDAMQALFGSMPLEIRKAELCRKVKGFGVYEPFEGGTFLSGRDNKMIVYIELDNFTPVERGEGEFEVRLEQEVALYTDWDGQKVWRNDTQEIVDRSRNRRRDFFVVQMITLPARLGVGKYVLKVDITDKHGGSIDAIPIEINLVADQSLVRSDRDRVQLIRKLLEEDDNKPLQTK